VARCPPCPGSRGPLISAIPCGPFLGDVRGISSILNTIGRATIHERSFKGSPRRCCNFLLSIFLTFSCTDCVSEVIDVRPNFRYHSEAHDWVHELRTRQNLLALRVNSWAVFFVPEARAGLLCPAVSRYSLLCVCDSRRKLSARISGPSSLHQLDALVSNVRGTPDRQQETVDLYVGILEPTVHPSQGENAPSGFGIPSTIRISPVPSSPINIWGPSSWVR